MVEYTLRKQSPWDLSIVLYMSYASAPVQTAVKFGKQTASFHFYNIKFDTYTIIYGVKLLSFCINYFLLSFSDYVEHSWNRLEHCVSISVLNN